MAITQNTRNSTPISGITCFHGGGRVLEELPWEGMDCPSLERFQAHLDALQCHLLQVSVPWQGLGLYELQSALPTPTILGFWDS